MASPNPDSNLRRVTLDLPRESMDIIDVQCKEEFITRKKWFFDAMMDKLEKDKLNKKVPNLVDTRPSTKLPYKTNKN